MADINLKDYKSNSNVSKEKDIQEHKKVNSVVSNKAKVVKKGAIRRFLSRFNDDDPSTIRNSIITGVIIPSIKKALDDTVHMLLYPNGGGNRRNDRASKISYRSFYDSRDDYPRETVKPLPRNIMDYDDVVFPDIGDAERVLDSMREIIKVYKIVTVADFYDLSEIDEVNYTSNKYGWTNLNNARVVRYGRDEYKILLPKAMPID